MIAFLRLSTLISHKRIHTGQFALETMKYVKIKAKNHLNVINVHRALFNVVICLDINKFTLVKKFVKFVGLHREQKKPKTENRDRDRELGPRTETET